MKKKIIRIKCKNIVKTFQKVHKRDKIMNTFEKQKAILNNINNSKISKVSKVSKVSNVSKV